MLKQISALTAMWAIAPVSFAQKRSEGRYDTLEHPVPTETPDKIEVLSFFHYGCNHCRAFDPLLEEWAEKLPADVQLHRIPAIWGEPLKELGRLYFTEERTDTVGLLHEAAFAAVQDQRLPLYTEEGVREWIKNFDIDGKAFMDTYKSFGVASAVKRADQTCRAYKLEGVPTLAVDGRYTTSASKAGSPAGSLRVVDELIAKVREERQKG